MGEFARGVGGQSDMLTLDALAKINLTLEVTGRRDDGFHEIRSVMQTIRLGDSLSFTPGPDIGFGCNRAEWLPDMSLVSRAVTLLKERTDHSGGVFIEVEKRIPLVSGLGGDSSDAATTLRGLNTLWGLDLSPTTLRELAAELGSDVPFFLDGGTALASGRGELLRPLNPPQPVWVVLLVPGLPLPPDKTARLYRELTPQQYTGGQATESFVNRLTTTGEMATEDIFNVFDGVASRVFDGIDIYRERMLTAGAGKVHLAGAGPALFTLCASETDAGAIHRRLIADDLNAYLTVTAGHVRGSG
jgi:4-diphosphocytidyl-2-C-methyl-D-erythritol kinase